MTVVGRTLHLKRRNEELQAAIIRLKDTIAEITTENLELKKKIGNSR